ncbi:MAG: ATP-binding protein [Flavobacteriales bacterium]|nr:ATP-binding protein [Flavobacteriales bacterium]
MTKISPFKHEYFLGYINQVLPQFVKVHFPSSVLLNGFTHFGKEFNGGLVGSFVVIEGDKYGFLGRITELSLPESERLSLNEKAFQTSDFHPTGKIEILLSFDLYNPFDVKKGLTAYPNIGAKVFVSSGELVQEYMSRFGVRNGEASREPTELGCLVSSPETKVKVNLQSIFGRHCAVVGTTGGGKSYTVSKLIESLIATDNKAILIDATGEYSNYANPDECLVSTLGIDSHFHYTNLSVSDLFVMFRPSGQVQQPLLLEAINSLKLVTILEREKSKFNLTTIEGSESVLYNFIGKNSESLSVEIKDGCLIKQGKPTNPFNRLCSMYSSELNDFNKTNFNIKNLTKQINNECFQIWGDKWDNSIDKKNQGNASSLILRIFQALSEPEFKKVFGFDNVERKDILQEIQNFINPENKPNLLRIAFDKVPYSFQIREIVANALGSSLLKLARIGTFNSKIDLRNKPLVLMIDEAHQFVNKSVKDEYFESTRLDAFDSIAKECRKHGLFLCIATQMPRDIPSGTLSQMGTFIVHRLINHNDKEAVSNACSSANKNTLDFLPILGEGEAILTGVDFPMPIIMKFDKPTIEPDSSTPKLN